MVTKMHLFPALLLIFVTAASARLVNKSPTPISAEDKSSEYGFAADVETVSGIRLLYRIYESCAKQNLLTCLKVKLIMGLDNAIRYSDDISLFTGVEFVRNNNLDAPKIQYKSEQDIESELPRSVAEKDEKLNAMIVDRIISLVQSRTLKVKSLFDDGDSNQSIWEGRGKKKKQNGAFVMIPLLLGGTFIPIAYGALAFLAGKALIVSKLALVLASIVGIKKLLNGNSGKDSQHEVVVSGHGDSGWARDIDLAYNNYSPKNNFKETF